MSTVYDTPGVVRDTSLLPRTERLPLLLERMSHGDRDAFGSFYDATARVVYGMALKVFIEPDRAHAVTRLVYVTAWTLAPTYSASRATPTDWLMSIVGEAFGASMKVGSCCSGQPSHACVTFQQL